LWNAESKHGFDSLAKMMAHLARLFVLAVLLVLTLGISASAQTTVNICKNSRPDCSQAVAFFAKFQLALRQDRREAIASMARYPLRVRLNGKGTVLRNKKALLEKYQQVFDKAVRCSILRAKKSEIWDNWQGFTIAHGEVWWERSNAANSQFKLITINNDAYYPGCGTGNEKSR